MRAVNFGHAITHISVQKSCDKQKYKVHDDVQLPGYPIGGKSMTGKPIDQSIKLVNWYRLVSVNR